MLMPTEKLKIEMLLSEKYFIQLHFSIKLRQNLLFIYFYQLKSVKFNGIINP